MDRAIEILLIALIIFTPVAFGSQPLWAFSLMELGILLILILWSIKLLLSQILEPQSSILPDPQTSDLVPRSSIRVPILLLSLFLGIVLLQIVPLPKGIIKTISPKTCEIRDRLTVISSLKSYESRATKSEIRNPKSKIPFTHESGLMKSEIQNPQSATRTDQASNLALQSKQFHNAQSEISDAQIRTTDHGLRTTTLSLFPLATKIEFFKWIALVGLFIFLLRWNLSDNGYRVTHRLIIATILVAVFESLYGIFEFSSGHHHILNLDWSGRISSVTGTFVNRNYFAGYLLMVSPLTVGFLFSREASQTGRNMDWRHRLSSMDGKTFLMWFSLILMILGLLLSGSRMGIVSLLLSFSLLIIFFRDSRRKRNFSRLPVMIFGLALLWAAWIGMDAVVSRFFATSENIKSLWVFWANTVSILKDFPLFGSGLGTFMEVFSRYRTLHIAGFATHAENDFLQLASEVGLIGVVPLLLLSAYLFVKAVRGIRSLSPEEPQRYIGIGGLVGIVALMFHSLVERNIQLPANAFFYVVLWAMVLGIALDPNSERIAPKE